MQTLAPSGLSKRPSFWEAEGEGAAGLEDGVDTHQPLVNAIALRQFPSRVFLSNRGSQILERPVILFGHGDRMVLHAFGAVQQEWLQAAGLPIRALAEFGHFSGDSCSEAPPIGKVQPRGRMPAERDRRLKGKRDGMELSVRSGCLE